jgi:UDP-N-acetylglucosamine 1-carboxyvinyltransferase
MHVPELIRMGAKISVNKQKATIMGVDHLNAAKVMASDLRASMCLILGGLVALGTSEIDGIYHLDRGYENIVDKLSNLGADIRRSR